MEAEFNFITATTLTILVGGKGGSERLLRRLAVAAGQFRRQRQLRHWSLPGEEAANGSGDSYGSGFTGTSGGNGDSGASGGSGGSGGGAKISFEGEARRRRIQR